MESEIDANRFPRILVDLELSEIEFERMKYAREVAYETLKHRREKSWRVFSWTSSVLLGVIGGTIGFFGDTDELSFYPFGLILIAAVVIIVIYSLFWVNQNLILANNASVVNEFYNKKLGVDNGHKKNKIRVGYKLTIAILAFAAIATIFAVTNF